MKGNPMMVMLKGKSAKVHDDEYIMGWELFDSNMQRRQE